MLMVIYRLISLALTPATAAELFVRVKVPADMDIS